MKKYNHNKVERKWQKKWLAEKIYEPNIEEPKDRGKFYNLMMFPYPSAEGLHAGNVYAFVGSDVYGRYMRMRGHDVFEPIGLDGFGIHSENYAIKIGKHPADQAKISEKNFYRQLQMIGNGFAWKEKVETYNPNYYKWTQWIFVQMFKNRLAYRKKASVNWCPSCLTVLADEQVLAGECERCGTKVIKKELEQWFFKITNYAQKLLDGLDKIDWSNKVKIAQRNWIGKSEGVIYKQKVKDLGLEVEAYDSVPQTFMAQTFAIIAPEHPLVPKLVKGTVYEKPVLEFVEKIKQRKLDKKFDFESTIEGTFTGRFVDNPFGTGDLPIWVASFVVMDYGTGFVNCSAHDERDFAFAKKYDIPLRPVMFPEDPLLAKKVKNLEVCYHHAPDGILHEPVEFKGMRWQKAREPVIQYIEKKGFGRRAVQYRLRDWLISRQRYWGAPIPMIYCEKCGWQAVPEKDLPVVLPKVKEFRPTGTNKSPLASVEKFYKTKCPKCGGEARRETDVSDTFLDSAWYYLRYPSVPNEKFAFEPDITKKWLPVDMYIGGAEHSVLHLLYSRFMAMALNDFGLIHFREPFTKFRAHGLLIKDSAKMSKSKGNVVNPDEYIHKYGADVLRMYLMFLSPFELGGDFRDDAIAGIVRFINRIWNLPAKLGKHSGIDRELNKTIKKVGEDIEKLHYNTAISELMKLLNSLEVNSFSGEDLKTFLKLLAPFAPHLAEEIWREVLGNKTSIHQETWPKYDPKLIEESRVDLVVQVGGKTRDVISIQRDLDESQVREIVLASEKIKKYVSGHEVKRVIYVANRLINIVVN